MNVMAYFQKTFSRDSNSKQIHTNPKFSIIIFFISCVIISINKQTNKELNMLNAYGITLGEIIDNKDKNDFVHIKYKNKLDGKFYTKKFKAPKYYFKGEKFLVTLKYDDNTVLSISKDRRFEYYNEFKRHMLAYDSVVVETAGYIENIDIVDDEAYIVKYKYFDSDSNSYSYEQLLNISELPTNDTITVYYLLNKQSYGYMPSNEKEKQMLSVYLTSY